MKRILLAMLVIFGVMQAGITFTTGSKVYIGNATLGIYGNITNNLVKEGSGSKLATIDFLPTSKVSFLGSTNDTITNIYTFPNIEINKPGGSVRLNNSTGNFILTGNISFASGNVITGTNTFELASTASVTGESASGYIVGTTKVAKSVGTGSNSFGGIGYSMSAGTGNLGTATVYRHTGDGSEEVLYGSEGIWRKWEIETSNAFSGTRQVTTSWLSGEDNGNVLSNLKVWKYDPSKNIENNEAIPEIRNIKSAVKTSVRQIERESEINISDVDDEEIYKFEEPKTLGWVEVDGAVFNTTGSPRTATYTIDAATSYTINDVANAFADGAGTEANPYQIATLDQLNAVRYYLSACFIQVADIDASATSTWNSGAGWAPITSFAGKYNGQGHTVSNLYVYRPGTSYVGLFGSTIAGSEIKDIGLENVNITGGNETGAFVGRSRGIIKTSYAKGSVYSSGYRVGGFMGYSQDVGSLVSNCYSDVIVTRLTGNTEITNFGGFCGRLYRGDVSKCYSTGPVLYEDATDPTNKGFLGAQSGGNMSNSFWNTETSGQITSTGNAIGLTSDGMRTLSNFTGATWDFQDESVNGTEDLWGINAVENSGFPFLSWEGITHNPSPFAGGVGTPDEPFLVSNLTQLNAVRNFLSYNFLQTADIDASATTGWNGGSGWVPIGVSNPYFTGNYDGDGHKIENLYFNSSLNYTGLFGVAFNGSVIKNLGLINIDANGGNTYSGTISGYSNSIISNCFATGTIRSNNYIGGFLGYSNNAIISDCYSKVDVTRTTGNTGTYVAGFVGYNTGTAQRCYSIGTVEYEGATNPTNKGFAGYSSGTITDSFWDIEVSGQTSSAGDVTGKTTTEMQNIATYTSLATVGLTNPWDFAGDPNDDVATNDYWNIHSSLNGGYPYLNWEYRIPVEAPANLALTVGATDVTITWDAVTGAAGYIIYSSADPYGVFTLDETGSFNGTEWTAPLNGSKMFYYVAAVNDTKINENKVIMVREGRVK